MQYSLRHYRIEPYHAPVGMIVTPDLGGIGEASSFERSLPRGHLGRLLPVRRINWAQTFRFHGKTLADYDYVERELRDSTACYKFRSNDQSRIVGRPEELLFWHSPDILGAVQGDVLTYECFEPSFRVSLVGSATLAVADPQRRFKHLWWVTQIQEFTQGLAPKVTSADGKRAIVDLFREPWDDTFSLLALH